MDQSIDESRTQKVIEALKGRVGADGVPLHPKYGWGGFLQVLDTAHPMPDRGANN